MTKGMKLLRNLKNVVLYKEDINESGHRLPDG